MLDRLRGVFTHNPFAKEDNKTDIKVTFANSQDLLDTTVGLLLRDRARMFQSSALSRCCLEQKPRHR